MKIDSYDNIIKWSYSIAKKWVQEHLVGQGVTSSRKFEAYKKSGKYLPKHFPRKPDEYFRNKGFWRGWPDFLGKPQNYSEKLYLSYEQASSVCQKNRIHNSIDYRNWSNRPANLPARPDQYYKENWISWQEFLGDLYEIPDRKVTSKLKESDVRIIKHQLELGVPGSVLAKTFGVSEMQISRIKKGENWSYV